MSELKRTCEGCCMQEQHSTSFLIGFVDFDGMCPCSICIIKVVCRKACEEYGKFCDTVAAIGEKKINGKM